MYNEEDVNEFEEIELAIEEEEEDDDECSDRCVCAIELAIEEEDEDDVNDDGYDDEDPFYEDRMSGLDEDDVKEMEDYF